MIPVKDPASGAAPVLHNQPEGTPDEHTDQITHIKEYRDHKKRHFIDDTKKIQHPDPGNEQTPKDKHFVSRFCGRYDVVSQSLVIDLVPYWFETAGKKFLRSQRHLIFDGDDLKDHVHHPHTPQKVQKRKLFEKIHSIQNREEIPPEQIHEQAKHKNHTASNQPTYINLSCLRHGISSPWSKTESGQGR